MLYATRSLSSIMAVDCFLASTVEFLAHYFRLTYVANFVANFTYVVFGTLQTKRIERLEPEVEHRMYLSSSCHGNVFLLFCPMFISWG